MLMYLRRRASTDARARLVLIALAIPAVLIGLEPAQIATEVPAEIGAVRDITRVAIAGVGRVAAIGG